MMKTAKQHTPAPDPLVVNSVGKAFQILSAFDASHPTLSLTELAAMTRLNRSAVQRFAQTLATLGYLRKDRATKRFALTVRNLDIANRFMLTDPLSERARPYLLNLNQTTQETVNLTILDGVEMVFVLRFLGRHVLNIDATIGSRTPVYCSAAGIAMLSRLPRKEAHALLERCERRAITPSTTWRLDDLARKIEATAARGYATAFEEIHIGDLSVAAAVVDGNGRPVGAINIAALRSRLTPQAMEAAYAALVVDTARLISLRT